MYHEVFILHCEVFVKFSLFFFLKIIQMANFVE